MIKILAKYADKPTFANARKVRAYERSHPMSLCLLSAEQRDLLANAIHHANTPQ
jgi:hypothetical protein